jgi:hypothetical protein
MQTVVIGILSGVVSGVVLKLLNICLVGPQVLKMIGYLFTFITAISCMLIVLVMSALMDKATVFKKIYIYI